MLEREDLCKIAEQAPDGFVQDAVLKANMQIERHRKIACLISGGSDSDIMLDLLYRLDDEKKIVYIWCDTGLEYEATKQHLKDIESKYGIEIVRLKTKKPIPIAIKEYGVPFLSKYVSEMVYRLQRHGFKWEDKPFDELLKEYPKCKTALRWWCNANGEDSRFNISKNKWLKEFMLQNPPTFKISGKCCHFAKKAVAEDFLSENNFDLSCIGVRKAEGGVRSTGYKNCFTPQTDNNIAQYRPLFWLDKKSKEACKQHYGIVYSDCYEVWGMARTGCASCPFGRNFEFELECIMKYEPKLYKAVNKIFGASYEYTRKYRDFQKRNEVKK